ncbi:hypothetical protein JL101_000805 [Skermanella rosea]|uniref:hypothetical protein n=1 Tax=Skermanella rosea TaxID=1817965 RepID=UPI001934B3CD|nr:hypothetical protein [Skermanella rosea]UEM04013.1 hypothetical protein JL101_000805 [Skermanella rosea]
MPTESRTVSNTKESLLLDQALDAVNRRIAVHQPASFAQIPHQPGPARSGFARAIGRARERGADFRAEYHRLSIEAMAAIGEPADPADMRKPEPDSAADPPRARSAAETPAPAPAPAPPPPPPAPPPPAPPQDGALETTKLFLQFLDSREKQLLDLMRAMVLRDQPQDRNDHEARINGQIDRLGKAVTDLTQVIGAGQPRFPRSIS